MTRTRDEMPSVSFKTIGCRLNQAETARLRADFEAAGYRVVAFGAACDVCVVHGCTVTRNAERDSIRTARRAKRAPGKPLVVLAGCVVERAAPELRAESQADLLAGQAAKFELVGLLAEHGLPPPAPEPARGRPPRFVTTRAALKVQDGCDFRCSYCIVPLTRGKATSRSFRAVLEEARALADAGYRELVLTGANIGCFRDGRKRLTHLIEAVERVPGIARIRLSSIEFSTVERGVIEHMLNSQKLCRFLHLPVQSGDDEILEAMGRRYTRGSYLEFVDWALARIPLLGLGTDIIVGFPGEDEPAFANTQTLVAQIPFSNLHVFPYSARPGTAAALLPQSSERAAVKQRVAALRELGSTKRAAFARRFIGREVRVLVERAHRGRARGWTDEYLEGLPDGRHAQNEIVAFTPRVVDGARLVG